MSIDKFPLIPLKIIKPGDSVYYQGRPYTVQFNTIRGANMYVQLVGVNEQVHEDLIDITPTMYDFNRRLC